MTPNPYFNFLLMFHPIPRNFYFVHHLALLTKLRRFITGTLNKILITLFTLLAH